MSCEPNKLNLCDAIKSGLPFRRLDHIGAFCAVNGKIVHHDNICNYLDRDFIRKNAEWDIPLEWLSWDDIRADGWDLCVAVGNEKIQTFNEE